MGGCVKKAVFLGDRGNVTRVYEKTAEKLCGEVEFIYPIYDRAELETRRGELSEVAFIFSTWGMWHFSVHEIGELFPSLEAVFYAAGSVKMFAREFIRSGVKVFSAWAANGIPVAQFTAAEIMLALKGFYSSVHNGGGEWKNHGGAFGFPGIMDEKIGIIGAGMIGRLVAGYLRELPTELLIYDKFADAEAIASLGGRKAELEEIFSECLVVSNHLANVPETVGMLDYSLFSRMRENAVFINTGRGAQVKQDDLVRALTEVKTRTALLDVTDPDEPPSPGNPLLGMKNVFLTPHIAGSIGNEIHRMAEFMYEEFAAYKNGAPTRYEVTERMLSTLA